MLKFIKRFGVNLSTADCVWLGAAIGAIGLGIVLWILAPLVGDFDSYFQMIAPGAALAVKKFIAG